MSCDLQCFHRCFAFFWQAIFNAQKTSVPGDLITVPGATEKISFICMLSIFIQAFIYISIWQTLSFYIFTYGATIWARWLSQLTCGLKFAPLLLIWKPGAPGSISRHQRAEIEGRTINRSLMCVAGIAYWVAGMEEGESNYIDEWFPIGMYTFFFSMFSESNNFWFICMFAFEHVGQSRNEM